MHGVPDIRMAGGVASPHRRARRHAYRSSSSAVSPTAKSHSSCRSRSRRDTRCADCAGSARNCATTTRRYWRAIFRNALSPPAFSLCGENCRQRMQSDPQLRHDWIEFEKMPQTVGVQINPFIISREANANSAHITQLGRDWECSIAPNAPRRRAGATAPSASTWTRSATFVSRPPRRGRCRANARTLMGAEETDICAQGNCRHIRAAGLSRILSRFRVESAKRGIWPISAASKSADLCGGEFRDRVRRLLLSRAVELLRQRIDPYGPGTLHLRELLAYAIDHGLRLFDFTIGDEQYKPEWSDLRMKLYDYSAATTWRGWPASSARLRGGGSSATSSRRQWCGAARLGCVPRRAAGVPAGAVESYLSMVIFRLRHPIPTPPSPPPPPPPPPPRPGARRKRRRRHLRPARRILFEI